MNDAAALVPQTVTVAYRATGSGAPASGFYTKSINLVDLTLPSYLNIVGSPWTKVLHRYEVATYSGGVTPTNQTALDNLATQYVTDWYLWQQGPMMQKYVGISEWTIEGFHDIEFRQSSGRITTSVVRGKLNPAEDLVFRQDSASGTGGSTPTIDTSPATGTATGPAFTFTTATTGTDFNLSATGATVTFALPSASGTVRGVVTVGNQTLGNGTSTKTFGHDVVVSHDLSVNNNFLVVGTSEFDSAATFLGYTNHGTNDIICNKLGGTRPTIFFDEAYVAANSGGMKFNAKKGSGSSVVEFDVASNVGFSSGMTSGDGQAGMFFDTSVDLSTVTSAWGSGNSYVAERSYVTDGGNAYRCILDNTSSATDEPGVGINWQTYWEQLSAASGTVHVAPVVTLTKNDGTYTKGMTASTGGLDFVSGWYVGGTVTKSAIGLGNVPNVDLTGIDFVVKTATGSLSAERVLTDSTDITWDWGTAGQVKGTLSAAAGGGMDGFALINGILDASVSANAITISIKSRAGNTPSAGADQVSIVFRDATASNSTVTTVAITSSTSVTVSAGSNLGVSTNNQPFRVWVVACYYSSTVYLGVINCTNNLNTYPLRDFMIVSTTTEGGAGAADSAGVIYTSSGLTTVPMRILGFFEYGGGLATAGNWSGAPTLIQNWCVGTALPGEIVQRQIARDTGGHTCTTTIPWDNTTPQNTEGTEVLTCAITPTSTVNTLGIDFHTQGGVSSGALIPIAALFQDSNANAIEASVLPQNGTTGMMDGTMDHEMQAGTTSATTFKVRVGPDSAGTIYINQDNAGNNKLNGTMTTTLLITEYMA